MAEPKPKKKAPPNPNSLAAAKRNRRNNSQHLKQGGCKPREIVTQPQLDFLNYILDGASLRDAWRWAGFPSHVNNCYELFQRPLMQATLKELQEKRKDRSVDMALQRKEERDAMVHHEFGHRLRTLKTHKYRGDESIVKLIEVGFRSTGAIQPNRSVVTATAGAQAIADAKPLYVPVWRQMQAVNPAIAIEGETLESVPQLEAGEQSPR
jgi:hypothetical protein